MIQYDMRFIFLILIADIINVISSYATAIRDLLEDRFFIIADVKINSKEM